MNAQDLYRKAKRIIPGGTQLFSKRPELYLPEQWPGYYTKAKGCRIWDIDGNEYIDMGSNGIGSCILGYADNDVDNAVKKAIEMGSMSQLNCPEEVELAEILCKLHPWAEMARFGRSGGECLAIAVRISRAYTGRDKIAFCGYHGWHDWYIAANLSDEKALDDQLMPGLSSKGVPRALAGTNLPFRWNDAASLREIFENNPEQVGTIVMEPVRHIQPRQGFLQEVREIADHFKAVLIFDEVTAGFRLNAGGIHLIYGVNPDMAVFAKAMSNGYPMGAVIGRRDVMDAAQETFISSTYWTERIGPTAALATIRKFIDNNVAAHLDAIGRLVVRGWKDISEKCDLKISLSGINPLCSFSFDYGDDSKTMATLFTQEMLKRGFLAPVFFYPTFAHGSNEVEKYLAAVDEVFSIIANGVRNGNCSSLLEGPVAHSGFKRLN